MAPIADTEIVLVASDGREFVIPKSHAVLSGMLKTMIDGNYIKDSRVSTGISSDTLKYVCKYFKYKEQCQQFPNEIKKFIIPSDVAKDLVLASTFLDC